MIAGGSGMIAASEGIDFSEWLEGSGGILVWFFYGLLLSDCSFLIWGWFVREPTYLAYLRHPYLIISASQTPVQLNNVLEDVLHRHPRRPRL